jgi:SHS2 domain-containing protein
MSALPADSYFDHDADVGIVGRGEAPEQAFEGAACAMFAIMSDITMVRNEVTVQFDFNETDLELALVTWLNALLAHAREQQAVFGSFRLQRQGDAWHGEASGQRWDETMERGVEVKGATLTMLSVRRADGGWEARCVVDV